MFVIVYRDFKLNQYKLILLYNILVNIKMLEYIIFKSPQETIYKSN